MSGIMRKLRDETERAKFEAARALRTQREQSKLSQLQTQKRDQLQALGEVVWEMFETGQVTDSRLLTVCHQVQGVNQLITDQEQLLEKIKQEQPPEPPKCPQCGREINANDAFCPSCGATIAKATTPPPSLSAVPGVAICPKCGKSVRAGAPFCGSCGSRMTVS